MRYLAAATVCIFLFLFLQLLRSPPPQTEIRVPSTKVALTKHGEWDHDPQLDRTTTLIPKPYPYYD